MSGVWLYVLLVVVSAYTTQVAADLLFGKKNGPGR